MPRIIQQLIEVLSEEKFHSLMPSIDTIKVKKDDKQIQMITPESLGKLARFFYILSNANPKIFFPIERLRVPDQLLNDWENQLRMAVHYTITHSSNITCIDDIPEVVTKTPTDVILKKLYNNMMLYTISEFLGNCGELKRTVRKLFSEEQFIREEEEKISNALLKSFFQEILFSPIYKKVFNSYMNDAKIINHELKSILLYFEKLNRSPENINLKLIKIKWLYWQGQMKTIWVNDILHIDKQEENVKNLITQYRLGNINGDQLLLDITLIKNINCQEILLKIQNLIPIEMRPLYLDSEVATQKYISYDIPECKSSDVLIKEFTKKAELIELDNYPGLAILVELNCLPFNLARYIVNYAQFPFHEKTISMVFRHAILLNQLGLKRGLLAWRHKPSMRNELLLEIKNNCHLRDAKRIHSKAASKECYLEYLKKGTNGKWPGISVLVDLHFLSIREATSIANSATTYFKIRLNNLGMHEGLKCLWGSKNEKTIYMKQIETNPLIKEARHHYFGYCSHNNKTTSLSSTPKESSSSITYVSIRLSSQNNESKRVRRLEQDVEEIKTDMTKLKAESIILNSHLMNIIKHETEEKSIALAHKHILSENYLKHYYSMFNILLIGSLQACRHIYSGFCKSAKKYKANEIISLLDESSRMIPLFGIGLRWLSFFITSGYLHTNNAAIFNLALFLSSESTSQEEIVRQIARQLTLAQASYLNKLSQKIPEGILDKIIQEIRAAKDWMFSDRADDPVMAKAREDVEKIIKGIVENTLIYDGPETVIKFVLGENSEISLSTESKEHTISSLSSLSCMERKVSEVKLF